MTTAATITVARMGELADQSIRILGVQLYGLEPSTGELLWTWTEGCSIGIWPLAVLADDTILVAMYRPVSQYHMVELLRYDPVAATLLGRETWPDFSQGVRDLIADEHGGAWVFGYLRDDPSADEFGYAAYWHPDQSEHANFRLGQGEFVIDAALEHDERVWVLTASGGVRGLAR